MEFARISIIDSITFISPMPDKDSLSLSLYADLASIISKQHKNMLMDFHLQQIFDVMIATGSEQKIKAFKKSDTYKEQQIKFIKERVSENMRSDIATYISEKLIGLSALSILKESESITGWIRNGTNHSSLRSMLQHVSRRPTPPSDQSDRNLCLDLIAAFPDLKHTVSNLASTDLNQHSLWTQLLSQIP